MINYILIAMDYVRCDFEKLQKEWESRKKIGWEIPVDPKKEGTNWVLPTDSKFLDYIRENDVVYFYVSNIPTNSGGTKSRILLRGVVKDGPHVSKYNDIYVHEDETVDKFITAITIGELQTLPKGKLKNDNFLSREELTKDYSDFIYPQGKRWPNRKSGNFSQDLIDFLNKTFKREKVDIDDFSSLIDHFNQECYFCGKMGSYHSHKTFKRRNGTDYYEYHHFIQQHKGHKNKQLSAIIDNSTNIISLCSNCHNKIHYGKLNEVEKMLKILWNDSEIQAMLKENNFEDLIKNDDDKYDDPFDWVKEIYRLSDKVSRKDDDNI